MPILTPAAGKKTSPPTWADDGMAVAVKATVSKIAIILRNRVHIVSRCKYALYIDKKQGVGKNRQNGSLGDLGAGGH